MRSLFFFIQFILLQCISGFLSTFKSVFLLSFFALLRSIASDTMNAENVALCALLRKPVGKRKPLSYSEIAKLVKKADDTRLTKQGVLERGAFDK